MCRLVVYAGAPAPVAPVVFGGEHSLYRQAWAPKELLSGFVNADGWGVLWYDQGKPLRLSAETPLWQAADLRSVLEAQASASVSAALRNATPGVPAGPTGTPPLLRAGFGFILNGFIENYRTRLLRSLLAPLSDGTLALMEGVTDSELIFLHVLDHMERGCDPGQALAEVVGWIRALARGSDLDVRLNCALTSAEGSWVTRVSAGARCNSLYRCRGGTLAPGGTLVASEPLDGDDAWESIPEQTLLHLAREGTCEVKDV